MYTNLEILIEQNTNCLTKNEKIIANYILDSPSIIIDNDIVSAAKEMFISKSTLTRFCTKIGLENYKELKYILKQDIDSSDSNKIQMNSILDEFHREYSYILDKMRLTIDDKSIDKVISLIKSAKKVYVVGIGQSGFLAKDFCLRLSRLGVYVEALTDIHFIQMACSICSNDELFIFISNSGKTKIINQSLRQITSMGCKSVLFTEFNKSNAAKDATLTILTPQKSNLPLANSISDQFGISLVIDIILHHLMTSELHYIQTYNKTIIDHNEL